MTKLVQSINQAAGQEALERPRIAQAVDVWWPSLEARLTPLLQDIASEAPAAGAKSRPLQDMVAEILDAVRDQKRLLATPERLLPARYLEFVLAGTGKAPNVEALRQLEGAWASMVGSVLSEDEFDSDAFIALLSLVEDPLVHVLHSLGREGPRMTLREAGRSWMARWKPTAER